jgi:hypothetical protein
MAISLWKEGVAPKTLCEFLFCLYHVRVALRLRNEEFMLMPQSPTAENRSGPRYVAAFPVRAEWDTSDGVHIVSEGETENVGPEGTLIHLQRDLPPVGGRVNLLVLGDEGEKLRVVAEVLRIERNPGHPQAALQLLGSTDEWRGLVWEEALIKMTEADESYDDDDF